ncbi:phosphoribosyltransferase-like protein [Flavobacterium panici]|uniref:PRTase-CE domain-containing protein n=1 Tax=Flavobacterium panici TaxID=2654843 RepID=A0A9N8P163_9FLAO|nr:hypothetical protein [Flavobacterium panici]CAC9973710.1 hypothetical protein FLAPXU55_01396 [Flavobacterium panici]
MDLKDKLHAKIKCLNETLWDGKGSYKKVNAWLNNFQDDEKIHALYLLSQCVYFNDFQIKQLLISIYRDLFKYPHIEFIRRKNGNTLDEVFIKTEYKKILDNTRFVSVGNPAESSAHLMYNFRNENKIPKSLFIHETQIASCPKQVENFVFLDDICGSGNQMVDYTKAVIPIIKREFPKAKIYYFLLLGTREGKDFIRTHTSIDIVDSVLELDNSFKTFHSNSRVFKNIPSEIDITKIHTFTGRDGKRLMSSIFLRLNPLMNAADLESVSDRDKFGYKDGQYLIAFNHNTPDNTLPVLWYNEDTITWNSIFKRAHKIY